MTQPDSGTARVLGHDVVTAGDAVRGLVSLTGQLASVDEDLTGRENLVLLGRLTPVMFVLMFTYLFGGAIAGSTAA